MHDLLDANYLYREFGNEKILRKIILPLEYSLRYFPRIIIKDSTINSICYGAKLLIPGILRYTKDL